MIGILKKNLSRREKLVGMCFVFRLLDKSDGLSLITILILFNF